MLSRRYGGGPVVRRHVIPIGSSALTKVEVYLLNLTVMTTTPSGRVDPSSARTLTVSRRLRVGEFRTMICKDFELDPKALRLWNFFSHSSEHALDDDARTLGEEGIVHGQTIVAQVRLLFPSFAAFHFRILFCMAGSVLKSFLS